LTYFKLFASIKIVRKLRHFMDLAKILEEFGLNKKEAAIYLAALEMGEASALNITKKAGIQRTYFYDLSGRLIALGLLRQIKKGKKRFFTALEPDKLLDLEEKKLKNLKGALPQLKSLFNTKGQKSKIFYYEGIEGMRYIINDSLSFGGEVLFFETPHIVALDQQKLLKEYIKKRIALGIKVRVIGEMSPEILNLKARDKNEMRETRILPKNIFSSDVEIGIYGNRIYIIDFKNEFGFIVEDNNIAHVLKKLFEIIWNSGKIIEKI